MERCFNCSHWILCRKTVYEDGSEIITSSPSMGKGYCDALNIETFPEFGCQSHLEGDNHSIISRKSGSPWQYWDYRACPDCNGRGSLPEAGMCYRCYGTSRVRFYDDGYIGEERTRLHPKEKELQCTSPQHPAHEFGIHPADWPHNVPKPEEMPVRKPPPNPFVGQDTQFSSGNGMMNMPSLD